MGLSEEVLQRGSDVEDQALGDGRWETMKDDGRRGQTMG